MQTIYSLHQQKHPFNENSIHSKFCEGKRKWRKNKLACSQRSNAHIWLYTTGNKKNLCMFGMLLLRILNLLLKRPNSIHHLLDLVSFAAIFFSNPNLLFRGLKKDLAPIILKWCNIFMTIKELINRNTEKKEFDS